MSALASCETSILPDMPKLRGRLKANSAIAQMTWFRVGGPADYLFKPADLEDLQYFLSLLPQDIPVTPLGVASNLLIRDGGIEGVVLRFGRDFTQIKIDAEKQQITVGAMCLDGNLSEAACQAAIGGLEFFSGIPGTIGGALRMNGGAYGTETCDRLISAKALDRNGTLHHLSNEQMGFSYRHCSIDKDWIFIEATFQGYADRPEIIREKITEIKQKREESQPVREKTGGSTFANPDGHKSWQLIDSVGGRGFQIGGAQMSEKHCNFMINTGDASAFDLEMLGEEMRRRVYQKHGVKLRWEIKRIGRFAPHQTPNFAFESSEE